MRLDVAERWTRVGMVTEALRSERRCASRPSRVGRQLRGEVARTRCVLSEARSLWPGTL